LFQFAYSPISMCQQCHQSHDDWAKWLIQTLDMTGCQLERKENNGQMNQQFDYAWDISKNRIIMKLRWQFQIVFFLLTFAICIFCH